MVIKLWVSRRARIDVPHWLSIRVVGNPCKFAANYFHRVHSL